MSSDKQLAVLIGADISGFTDAINSMQGTINKFNNNVEKGFGGIGNKVTSMFSGIGKVIAGAGIFKAVDAGINMITASFDDAIARVDTLNQFPRVLQQMGYSAEEAQASTDQLAKGIQGLPTTLDGIVGSTQRLVNIFGDVEQATDSALALNNAFLASGASAGDASRGLEQYTQMLSAGKVDAQSWRTLQETMPYALNKTAEAFGFTGKSAQNDFYKALQDGDITMDDFNSKIIELSDGTGGFAEVALEASKGIQTSWANIKTAITTGVANIISAFDDWLEAEGFGGIAGVLDVIKVKVSDAFKVVSQVVPKALKAFKGLFNAVKDAGVFEALSNIFESLQESAGELWTSFSNSGVLDVIVSAFESLWQAMLNIDFQKLGDDIVGFVSKFAPLIAGITAGVVAFKLITGAITLYNTITTLATTISTAFGAVMAFITSPIGLVVLAIGALVAVGVLLYQNWETVVTFLSGLWDSIKAKAEELFPGIGEFLSGVWEGIKTNIETVWNGIVAFLSGLWDLIKSIAMIAFESMKTQIDNVLNLIKGIFETVMLLIQGDWSGAWEKIKTTVGTFISATLENITTTFGSIYDVIKEKVTDVYNAVAEWFAKIPAYITEKWGEVTTFLSGISLFQIGSDIISGLWEGIKGKWSEMTGWIGEKANGLKEFFTNPLGINSPSKVMRDDVGQWIPKGIAVGIEANTNSIRDAISHVNDKIVNARMSLPDTTLSTTNYTNALNPVTAQYVFKDDEANSKSSKMIELMEELVEVNHQLIRKNQALVINGQAFAEVVTDDINYQNSIKDSYNRKIQGLKG